MALRASSGLPAWAAASSFSSMSVILVIAEWTMSKAAPESRRRLATRAMLRQLASEETLVPPNLTTTQREAERADMRNTFVADCRDHSLRKWERAVTARLRKSP